MPDQPLNHHPPGSIDTVLNEATLRLIQNDTARLDAEILLCHILKKSRSYLFTWPEKLLSSEQKHQFDELLSQREKGTPVAYLIGEKDFWSLKLKVNPSVLIPRPDTELIVEMALEQNIPDTATVADLGTGTGAIALSMACERPNWVVLAVDKFSAPLDTAKENAQYNNISNVRFYQGSWCEPFCELTSDLSPNLKLDMIVSNPPYIRTDDEHLQQGDVRFEPMTALTSGIDGLDDIRVIAHQAFPKLRAGGALLLEHGYDQGTEIRNILSQAGFCATNTRKDLAGHDRVTLGIKPA